MKILFNISSPMEESIPKLISSVSYFKCRVHVDLENYTVLATDMNSLNLEDFIDLVNNHFKITSVDIDTTDMVFETEPTVVVESKTTRADITKIDSKPDPIDAVHCTNIKFGNIEVEEEINKLLKVIYQMISKKNIPAEQIINQINSVTTEFSMKFNPKPNIDINVGDIVDCLYGTHLDSEVSGGHVHVLICNIINDIAFVIPIAKGILEGQFNLPFSNEKDVIYSESDKYNVGTLILDRGNYIGIERLNKVVGKALPEFFDEVIEVLPEAYCFGSMLSKNSFQNDGFLQNSETMNTDSKDSKTNTGLENVSKAETTIKNDENAPNNTTKDLTDFKNIEEALSELIGETIQSLDKNSDLESQLDKFLAEIKMSNNLLVKQAFVAACKVKKLKFESILIELKNKNPNYSEEEIKKFLKDTFKTWLSTNYPIILEQFPRISFMQLLKFFSRNYK